MKTIDKGKVFGGGAKDNDEDDPAVKNSIVLLNTQGTAIGFRAVSELEKELSCSNFFNFPH